MLRALFLKEWKQLRALRWVGLGLGLVVLLVALAAPAVARQGWLPFADITRSYSAKEIILDALPAAFAIGLWPLIAFLVVVQTFAGDRNTGTESFLLERPVSRARVWSARLLASAFTVVVAVVGHLALWWVVMKLSVDPVGPELTRPLFILVAVGPVAVVCCLLAGMLAASLLSSPMAALLLGIVLLAIPLQLAGTLVGAFPLATYRGIPVGPIAPILLLLAYPLASFLALCRGEPAGRGRIRRGVVTVAVVLVTSCALFVVTATAAIRLSARALPNGAHFLAAPTPGAVFAAGDAGGWILDPETAEARRFLPGPRWRAAWKGDGSTFAVIKYIGALGGPTSAERLQFFNSNGESTGRELVLDKDAFVSHIMWAGDRVVLSKMITTGLSRIVVYAPETGERRVIPLQLNSWPWSFVGPTDDGRVFLAYDDGRGAGPDVPEDEPADSEGDEEESTRRGVSYGLYEIDLSRGALADEPVLRDFGVIWYRQYSRLSPSGRFWLVDDRRGVESGILVLDVETGERLQIDADRHSTRWLDGDLLAWTRTTREPTTTRLLLGRPGEPPTELRVWSGVDVSLLASPDRNSLLAISHEVLEEQAAAAFPDTSIPTRRKVEHVAVYELDTKRWIDLARWPEDGYGGYEFRTEWAGPRTVARTGPGVLAFESIDAPGKLRAFLGDP
jgi:ABC-type transport system involved in multi-copper enzyme maturation permease subunit